MRKCQLSKNNQKYDYQGAQQQNKDHHYGDFNAALNPTTDRSNPTLSSRSWKPEAGIFEFLMDWAFTDYTQHGKKEHHPQPGVTNAPTVELTIFGFPQN
jgi:hypothetical protein